MALETTIDDLGIDLLQNILSRLPAFSFASADCVNRSWNHACGRVLCRPRLSSACSFNPSFQVAVEDVLSKVLSEPIRPQFAIASVRNVRSEMQEAYQLITAKLSSKVPVIINMSGGIIGRDAVSDEFKEIMWKDSGKGIVLTVGFTPGLKVKLISLLTQPQDWRTFMVDQFITDIREFSTSKSGCQSPAAIMFFGAGVEAGMEVVMEKLDYAMSPETVIVGGFNSYTHHSAFATAGAAVALVFVTDKNKPPGIGETKFHAVLSSGLSPVGATRTMDDFSESINGDTGFFLELGEGPFEADEGHRFPTTYIGVTKRRKCSIGQEEAKWKTSLAYHLVINVGNNGALPCVHNMGIKPGDTYRYYREDSCVGVGSNLLKSLKQRGGSNGSDKLEVCGGLVFASSSYRSVSPNAYSSAFLENFPGVTFSGDLCSKGIARGYLNPQESQEQKSVRACLHVYSAVYFIISYAS